MIQVFRNALIGIALGIAAILVVALLDGAFINLLPSVGDLRVGPTNLATCLVMVELFLACCAAGYLGNRRRTGLFWVVLPVVALYVSAVATAPYVYGCNPTQHLWGCAFVHSPFVIGIVATCCGYVVAKSRVTAQHVV